METPKETTSVMGLDGSTGCSTPTEEPPACQQAPRGSLYAAVQNHMLESVRPSGLIEFELLILTICTGIQDAVSFPDFHCFASNQTGNTVLLMLAVVLPHFDGNLFDTAKVGAALGLFLVGGCLTGQLGHYVGAKRRWWLVFCSAIQTGLVFAAAAIQQVSGGGTNALAVISLLAFASGSQVVQPRSFVMPEISTAMATAAWVDLVMDPRLLGAKNRARNRRASFLLALVLGCLMGAGIYKTAGSPAALFVSAAGKMLVTVMYLFNSAEQPKQDDVESNSS